MESKNSRIERIKRAKERKIVGIRYISLRDCLAVWFVTLIGIGIMQSVVATTKQVAKAWIQPAKADAPVVVSPLPTPTPYRDERVQKLQVFLESNNSPLAPYAKLIVEEADRYDIGWTTIVSISFAESHYGTRIKPASFNAWGIGGADNFTYFASWEDSIKYTSWLIGTSYKWNQNKGIQVKYCPTETCNATWATTVTEASHKILATEK